MWNNDEMLQRLSCEEQEQFYAAVSPKRNMMLFFSLDWFMIVSSFILFFSGHWGEKCGGEDCSESHSSKVRKYIYLHEILADTYFIYKVLCS